MRMMPEILQERDRTARKAHICSYCGETIKKGETYEWAKLKSEGQIYEWKNHRKCGFIAAELWDYADPDDGMTEDDFMDSCREFSQIFVCPDCPNYDAVDMGCVTEKGFCTDRIYDFLQTHELYRAGREGWAETWKCRERSKA